MSNPILENVINNCNPNRIASPFQCLSLKDKIMQHYLTSLNITFGNCLENNMRTILQSKGARYIIQKINEYHYNHLCIINNNIIMVEQAIRDDHDSTKRVGLVQSYLKKKNLVKTLYPEHRVISMMWFIDDAFKKNQSYYQCLLGEDLVYGEEIFNCLSDETAIDFSGSWEEFLLRMIDTKQELYLSDVDKIFEESIDINEVSLSKLYDYMIVGYPKEIIDVFFRGQDYSNKILAACDKARKTNKVKLLMELITDGYFK